MDRRTFESPMDWEYQNQGPLDPTSPFARLQSAGNAQNNNAFGLPRSGTFGQHTPFARTQSSPQKPPASSAAPAHTSSLFTPSSSRIQRTNTAPPFRNPAFTTPRKPFDMDALSEASAAEDSPAPTDVSDCPDTPETDQKRSFAQMTLTPARSKALSAATKRSPGKGEIPRATTAFGTRDKVRKRKRRHDDKDISGFRMPYKYQEEWDDTEGNDSDDSTYQPNERYGPASQRPGGRKRGWLGRFLSDITKNPDAPRVLGYWITFLFNLSIVGLSMWVIWLVVASFRDDLETARVVNQGDLLDEIAKCAKDYRENMCSPREKRIPAIGPLCDQWEICMNQDPNSYKKISLGAKNLVEILNDIIETMSWKTMAASFALITVFLFSGASLINSNPMTHSFPPPVPQPSQPVFQAHPQIMYGHVPQTPRSRYQGLMAHDETPDTDASPGDPKALPPPLYYQTPSGRRSPSKGDRGRSPTKSRSPTKRY
ncbi:hypothetical protein JX265_007271 [Neoarthrinium moseri]|uniref:Brl1/Brr6 domain-containing protein n=1 Tax=Neoarthrinium moseri TaxID=1658444 RepID=A0A9Q0ANL9_9PEZI|nr:uncharacterized protein JN550_012098 [Neoarthrinium moseri]KAI1850946.1 hypothetical protein JX266_003611 [Neoarthrinium moseri]KAI1859289.1 hypothetical protein JN550_012098 [Neoarthrinium moseri]KAI1867469.1 hypothetical protein JX265_007271 [Neoarthrinium moseri]